MVIGKIQEIVAQCVRRGITVGTFVDTVESARKMEKAGGQIPLLLG